MQLFGCLNGGRFWLNLPNRANRHQQAAQQITAPDHLWFCLFLGTPPVAGEFKRYAAGRSIGT